MHKTGQTSKTFGRKKLERNKGALGAAGGNGDKFHTHNQQIVLGGLHSKSSCYIISMTFFAGKNQGLWTQKDRDKSPGT